MSAAALTRGLEVTHCYVLSMHQKAVCWINRAWQHASVTHFSVLSTFFFNPSPGTIYINKLIPCWKTNVFTWNVTLTNHTDHNETAPMVAKMQIQGIYKYIYTSPIDLLISFKHFLLSFTCSSKLCEDRPPHPPPAARCVIIKCKMWCCIQSNKLWMSLNTIQAGITFPW